MRVFSRVIDGEETHVISFFVESINRNLRSGDIAVGVDQSNQVISGSANLTFDSAASGTAAEIEMYSVDNNGIKTHKKEVERGRPISSEGVESNGASCSNCKSLYGVVCGDTPCNIGYASICYLFTGGYGAVWCAGLVGDLCDFLDDNSCEAGLNEAVCQVLGYCSTDPGEDPCDEYDFDGDHCSSG